MRDCRGSRALGLLLAAAGILSAGCGQKPASLEVKPRKIVLYGLTHPKEVEARVLDRKGREMIGLPLAWESSDRSVVESTATGHVTAHKPGRATLTVSVGKISAKLPVEVIDLADIAVSPMMLKLLGPPGTSARLEVAGRAIDGGPVAVPRVAWSADNPKVVRVSPDGVVTSLAAGKTTVIARVGDLISESEVRVENKTISRLELHAQIVIFGHRIRQSSQDHAQRLEQSWLASGLHYHRRGMARAREHHLLSVAP